MTADELRDLWASSKANDKLRGIEDRETDTYIWVNSGVCLVELFFPLLLGRGQSCIGPGFSMNVALSLETPQTIDFVPDRNLERSGNR